MFAYDDIAYHTSNPFPGKIFNKPSSGAGFNVYHNCKIDYKGNDVTPTNYINVITGTYLFCYNSFYFINNFFFKKKVMLQQ